MIKMEIEFKKFELLNATRNEWTAIHTYRRKYHSENIPDEPFLDGETFEKIIRAEMTDEQVSAIIYGIYNEKNFIGSLYMQYFKEASDSYKGNEQNLFFKIELDKDYRQKGIGTQALVKIAQTAELFKKSFLITMSEEEDGRLFLEKIGAKVGLSMKENRLYLKDVDWSLVNSWVREGEERNPMTNLILFKKVPDFILENYCKTLTFAGNQAPRDDLKMGDFVMTPKNYRKKESDNEIIGVTNNIACTVERDGTVSGLTELISISSDKIVLRQGLTAVLEDERGRKLGKWLKASLLLYVKKNYPDVKYIQTHNATSNGPMLAINTKLGFKLHKEKINSQLSLADLHKYLENKGLSPINDPIYLII